MNYVEWLRVRNGLRIYAIVLGAAIVLALIVRISVNGQLSNNEFIVSHIEHDPGTVVTHSVVNGLNRTTFVNAQERTTITIDDQNDGGKLIHIVRPASKDTSGSDHTTVASFSYDKTAKNGIESITFNTDAPMNFVIFLMIGSLAALIFATVWGCSFACEHGHLEYALLKPVTRTRYAFGLIGFDVLGMALAGVMTIIAAIICISMFELPHFDFSKVVGPLTALLFLVPLAWYALLNAATVFLKRGTSAIIGFSWPIAFVLISLSQVPLGDSPTGRVFHAIFWSVAHLIPITYGALHFTDSGALVNEDFTLPIRIAIVTGLTLIYGALALVQWRRVEA